ncbi:MAG: O-methyltransferase [Bacteroidetes bacterium]|nr:O-methyltransferase [Bacteroidota bacterium]MBU1720873.1 O-methyltransferase [Bacteroidota bacterium]
MDNFDAIYDYCTTHSGGEDAVLARLNRETHAKVLYARMISGPVQGKLLQMLASLSGARRILEIGTFTGYSAICLARGMAQGGELHTIEKNPEIEDFAHRFFIEANLSDRIIQHIGDALEIIPSMTEKFDLIFIDADKEHYPEYLDLSLPLLNDGGLLIADNVLWDGKVLDPEKHRDKETQGIVQFNAKILKMNELERIFLPIRDGLLVCRKSIERFES